MIRRNRPQSIEIPERNQNEVVEVFLDELPDNPEQIKSIIIEEGAPIELFLQFATEYYYQEKPDAFKLLVQAGLKEGSLRGEQSLECRKSVVALLSALAAFYIAQGLAKPAQAAAFFEEATITINEADKRDSMEESLWLRKGLLLLAQGKTQAAEYQFGIVASKDSESIPAHIGLGTAAFLSGNYQVALRQYQLVLKKLPSSPHDIRLAIGYCLMRLSCDEAARKAFERVLDEEPKNVHALVALAVMHLNRAAQAPAELPKGMQLLKQVYDLDRHQPTALCHLANHFFFKKDLPKALSLALSALEHSSPTVDEMKAEAHFFIAKIYHAQGTYDLAFEHYSQAVKFNPSMALAQLGLAQMCIHRGDLLASLGCLERVREVESRAGHELVDTDFLAMFGLVSLRSNQSTDQAEDLIRRAATQSSPDNNSFNLWIALASLLETHAYEQAISAYQKARSLDPARFECALEYLNNSAVVLHALGKMADAHDLFRLAKGIAEGAAEAIVDFNMARLMEDEGRLEEAERTYKELSVRNPADIQVHLRLGIIASKRGQYGEAADHYKEAIGIEEANLDAWTLLAANHLHVKAITPARKAFERILKQNDRHDLYSLVALGNIYVEIARHERRTLGMHESLKRALEFYIKALQLQPHNYLAANGVGLVMAEMGRYKEAKEVFLQVRQANPDFVDAWVNLAHCFVEIGQYPAAIHTYEQALERTERQKATALRLLLARTHYIRAKSEKNLGAFELAIEQLQMASEQLPKDTPIQYNIALCQQEVASVLLKRGLAACTDEDVFKAISMLDAAFVTFTALSDPELATGGAAYDLTAVKQRAKYCQSLRTSLEGRVTALRQVTQERMLKLEVVRKGRESQLKEEALKVEQERERRRREQERNEEIRRELAAKLRDTEEKIKMATQSASTSNSEGEKEEEEEEEEEQEEDDIDGIKEKRRKRGESNRGKERKRGQHTKGQTNVQQVRKGGENNFDQEEDELVTMAGRTKRRMVLSKDFLSDSDLSDAEEKKV